MSRPMTNFDCIVLGTGGVGSAALYHLAKRGFRALGIDRFPPGHDRGSSHGDTRIIRQAYFEHPDYVPLLFRAFELWAELEKESGKKLYFETGLLQVGPEEGVVVPGVLRSARIHGLAVEKLLKREVEARFPGFRVPEGLAGVFERRAGYLLVEECVRTHLELARRRGAELRIGEAVLGWEAEPDGFRVRTDRGGYAAAALIIAAGPWAGSFLKDLGVPLEVRRKPLFWFETRSPVYRSDRGAPAFLFETSGGVFYGFPEIDAGGLKVAEHSGGDPVADPLAIDRRLRPEDRRRVEAFLQTHLPEACGPVLKHAVCMYTMTPDEHFILDRHPVHSHAAFAAGLSGHGFKFTGVLGEALAELALDGKTRQAIEFLSWKRFLTKIRSTR